MKEVNAKGTLEIPVGVGERIKAHWQKKVGVYYNSFFKKRRMYEGYLSEGFCREEQSCVCMKDTHG